MIGWLAPYALLGLALLAAPIVIHLLRTQRAPRIAFPTLRFVKVARSRAARPRLPSDPWLLLLRLLIVAAIVAAAARPVFLFPARVEAWNGRVARVVLVRADAGPEARASADAELAAAYTGRTIAVDDVREGLVRAAAWLDSVPPARRDIVVVGRVPAGGLDQQTVARLPADIGLRFAAPPEPAAAPRVLDGGHLLGAPGVPARRERVRLDESATAAEYAPEDEASIEKGLTLVAAPDQVEELTALRRAVARSGAPSPEPTQPVVIRFAGARAPVSVEPIRERWMVHAILRLSADDELRRALARFAGGGAKAGAPPPSDERWFRIPPADAAGAGLRAASAAGALVLEADVPADDFAAAVLLRAVLRARRGSAAQPETEVLSIPTERLVAWSRSPGDVTASAWTRADAGDARWLWVAVALLLGLEQWVRRRRASSTGEMARAA